MEENKVTETTEETVDYIQAIADLKAGTVSKDQYAKLKEENKRLLDAIVSGDEIEVNTEKKLTYDELTSQLLNYKGNDVDYAKLSLAHREAALEAGKEDPYLPVGREYSLTAADYEKADRTAQILGECVEESNGNNGVFLAKLQERMTGTALDRMKLKK